MTILLRQSHNILPSFGWSGVMRLRRDSYQPERSSPFVGGPTGP